ncbi:hypothetical protein U5A82_06705 [Sphingobium sp. CR2-8]|uniref:hypothetical protein n=1 Tax=Sphingobium sp. CR2-8 TaxID=1306534 RepID=UPI002DBFBEFA|nr:hypothetical protein [Sphingobium sp. CR2-8]MEC3910179.1 hypothetical protein [Sphingobium sp. CR2-8]
MQDFQEQAGDYPHGLFGRWRMRLAQTLLRDASVVLIDRDADTTADPSGRTPETPSCEIIN